MMLRRDECVVRLLPGGAPRFFRVMSMYRKICAESLLLLSLTQSHLEFDYSLPVLSSFTDS